MFKKFLLIFCLILLCIVIFIIYLNMDFSQDVDNISISNETSGEDFKEVYLTIMPAKDNITGYANSFYELNSNIDEKLVMEVLFQEGEGGLVKTGFYGYSLNDANGTLKLAGDNIQIHNSYKIKLDDSLGLWQGMDVFYLNKYIYDNLKIRTKLSSDLFEMVSDFANPKTEFVHVYIKDNSVVNNQQEFIDYGLYTVVENIDRDFLINYGLDSNGWVYEANNFEFLRYQDNIRSIDDSNFSKTEFEEILEIEGNEEHSKLIDMLNIVNNTDFPINQIFDQYFDEDNYLTWLAFNILIGNIESRNSDYYLYSGMYSDKWFFIIGDYTDSFGSFEKSDNPYLVVSPWQEGISNYWGVQLHKRYLQIEENRDKLSDKIEKLSSVLSSDLILDLLESYRPLIKDLLTQYPDSLTSLNTLELIDEEFKYLSQYIEQNKEIYYLSLDKPMPVNMFNPQNYGGYILFTWSDSYDFQGDIIQYTLDISTSIEFDNIVYHEEIKDNKLIIEGLESGHYYWRLRVEDSMGNIQVPFDSYIDNRGKYYFGIQEFFIN